MKTLIIYLGKKYVLSALNDLLEKYKDNVTVITTTISTWIARLEKIVEQLKKINTRVADGEISDTDVNDSISEITDVVKSF